MRRWAFPLAAALLTLAPLTAAATPAATGGNQEVRVYVEAGQAVQKELQAKYGKRHGFAKGFTLDVPESVLAELQSRPGIRVERVSVRRPQVVSQAAGKGGKKGQRPLPADQIPWGVAVTYGDAGLAAVPPYGGSAVVAIIDTGVAPHLDLAAPAQCKDFTDRKAPVVDGRCADTAGHGTHVAGTIAANGGADGLGIYGVAPGVPYYAYKVCGRSGLCYSDDIAAAVRTAADQGASIISMSLGGNASDPLEEEAIAYAASQGVLVVAAAGNDGPDPGSLDYPAALPQVVAVASLYQGQPGDVAAANLIVNSWSSRGISDGNDASITLGELELAAPGYAVESTYKDGGYAVMSGTSMATPHVTGLAALVWDAQGGSAARVRSWLVFRAGQFDVTQANQGGAGAGYDIASGYGNPRVP